jgi:membrane protein implicated in regulation of membrane protease activity
LRRWILGSLIALSVAAPLFGNADLLGRIAIFILTAVLIVAGYRARSLVVGDEDEVRAALRRESSPARESVDSDDAKIRVDGDEWERAQEALLARQRGPIDAPLAPILEGSDPASAG